MEDFTIMVLMLSSITGKSIFNFEYLKYTDFVIQILREI